MSENNGLISHLYELRITLIRSTLIIFLGTLVCWYFNNFLFTLVRNPISQFLTTEGLIYTGVTDKFLASMKISLLGGIIFTCPLWLYQVWSFISPGLHKKERKFAVFFCNTWKWFIYNRSFICLFCNISNSV